MPLDAHQAFVLKVERKKLQAVQAKLPTAIEEKNLPRVLGLALAAERIAARLVILLDNVR